jgi:hypothetical protein
MINSEEYISDWPDEIRYFWVAQYTEEKLGILIKSLETEYEYILDFLENAKLSHEANCENYFYRNSLVQWLPVYKDGEFLIRAIKRTVLYWDNKKEEYIPIADINIVTEIGSILEILYTYNELIDFWYKKTGNILREKYDIVMVMQKWSNLIK